MAEKKVRPLPLENMATGGVPSAALVEALKSFCKSVVGNGVISLSEVKDKLLLRQTTASDQDPLRLTPLILLLPLLIVTGLMMMAEVKECQITSWNPH